MKFKYLFLFVTLIIVTATFSVWCANSTYHTDFVSFYRAGCIIWDDSIPVTDVYRSDDPNISKYNIPDPEVFVLFRYSMLAACIFSPLALLNYDTANAIFIFINIICYILSVFLVLRAAGAKGRWFVYPLILSLFWMPFVQNVRWGQSNALILLLITVGILAAKNNRIFMGGIALAIATLFKPFALAVTMVLCIKNWRIAISYMAFLVITLIVLPGTAEWFHSFLWPPHPWFCYSAMYLYLNSLGIYYFWIYALLIGALTALVAYYSKESDYLVIGSLAIPAAFLAMPVLEIQYPTILIFTYAFLVTQKLPINMKTLSVISFLLIFSGTITTQIPWIYYSGILLIWLTMILLLISSRNNRHTILGFAGNRI